MAYADLPNEFGALTLSDTEQSTSSAVTDNGSPQQAQDPVNFDLPACREKLRKFYLKHGNVQLPHWAPRPAPRAPDDSTNGKYHVDVNLSLKPYRDILRSDDTILARLLTSNSKRVTRVLLVGDAGSGKSTTAANIAYKWAVNQSQPTESVSSKTLSKFTLVFLIHMHEIGLQDSNLHSNASLVDIIFQQILKGSQVSKEGLKSYIKKNEEKVLLLFDGLDKSHENTSGEISKILNNKKLLECCVILTTRPFTRRFSSFREHLEEYAKVKLIGFLEKNILQYIRSFFGECREKQDLIKNIQKDAHVMALAATPLQLFMICLLWNDPAHLHPGSGNTKTQLYQNTINYLWEIIYGTERPLDFEFLNKFGEVGFNCLEPCNNQGGVTCSVTDLRREVCDLGCQMGIIDRNPVRGNLQHSTFWDFCIAMYITRIAQSGVWFFEKLYCITPSGLDIFENLVLEFCNSLLPQIKIKHCTHYLLQKLAGLDLEHLFGSQCQECLTLDPDSSDVMNLSMMISCKYKPDLVRLSEIFSPSTQHATFKCGRKCVYCKDNINEGDFFTSHVTKRSYKTSGNINCTTSNVIYLISCRECGIQYVGSTTKQLKSRFQVEKSDAKSPVKNKPDSLNAHFKLPEHSVSDMMLQGIESLGIATKEDLGYREGFWIELLETRTPSGLNIQNKPKRP